MNKILVCKTIKPIFITIFLSFWWLVFKAMPTMVVFYGQQTMISLLIVLLILQFEGRSGLKIYGFKNAPLIICFFAVFIAFVHMLMVNLLNDYYLHVYSQKSLVHNPSVILVYLKAIVLTPIEEELIYRGYLQTKLVHLSHKGIRIFKIFINIPILIPAIIFAFSHIVFFLNGITLLNITYILVNPFLFGVLSGYFKEKTGSIYPSIIMHSAANLSIILIYTFIF